MAESGNSKQFKLKVANFGPIAEADIDLRPMTVFVGPSNTGKSYLAMLIYALHRFFNGARIFPFHAFPWARREDDDFDMSKQEIDALLEWVKLGALEDSIPPAVDATIRRRLREISAFGGHLNDELARCFGIEDTWYLIRRGNAEGARVDMDWRVSNHPEPLSYNLTLNPDRGEFDTSVPDTLPLSIDPSDIAGMAHLPYRLTDDEDRKDFSAFVMNNLSASTGERAVCPLGKFAYYLPADRTGVMHAHRVVVGSLIARAARAGLAQGPTEPTLSGVLADFLERLIRLGDLPRRRSRGDRKISDGLEREMIRGAIIGKNSAIGYPEFYYRPDGWERDIPLMNSSSMVSELAPVVLYLRHVVEPGDVLIIEEPESHLHPSMQVEFVRQLAAVVNAGIRVMLTTHSEWVLEELANLVQLSKLPEPSREQFKGPDSALTPDKLGVWLFDTKESPEGTVVREIPLDLEIGNFPSGYDVVATETYNRWAEISNLIGTRR